LANTPAIVFQAILEQTVKKTLMNVIQIPAKTERRALTVSMILLVIVAIPDMMAKFAIMTFMNVNQILVKMVVGVPNQILPT